MSSRNDFINVHHETDLSGNESQVNNDDLFGPNSSHREIDDLFGPYSSHRMIEEVVCKEGSKDETSEESCKDETSAESCKNETHRLRQILRIINWCKKNPKR